MFWFLILFCVFGCIWGKAVNKVLYDKGYTEDWFWWGFFFGWIPLVIACLMPEKVITVNEDENYFGSDEPIVVHNNAADGSDDSKKTLEITQVPNGWKCPVCGEMNAGYADTCSCGYNPSGTI